MPKKLIVGLGNPGKEYTRTRHNLGFWALDLLAEKFDAPWKGNRHKAILAETTFEAWRLLLAKPTTYMNLSGESVSPLLRNMEATPEDLIVVCDDVNIPLGTLRLRQQGGAGGHHGLESIMNALGTKNFSRIRLGVKPLEEDLPPDLADFVLGAFRRGEEAIAVQSARKCVDAILVILEQGFDKAMNQFNSSQI